LLNELFIFQSLITITLFFFITTVNLITLWYLAGVYLIVVGLLLLTDDADIFVGFLWVIDLGVGLIFFIFILHFTNFLYQKATFNITNRTLLFFIFLSLFLLLFLFFMANPSSYNFNFQLKKIWFFFVSWYDYYVFYNLFAITELNLLREMYFYNNAFVFFLINFMLFYGIFISINLCFLIKKVFIFLNFSQIKNVNLLQEINSTFFIRNQNFLKQQNTSAGTRVWLKKKFLNKNDL
jgi:hypothetical protein